MKSCVTSGLVRKPVGRLESVYIGETFEERMTSLEEQLEREEIYMNHLQEKVVLVTVIGSDQPLLLLVLVSTLLLDLSTPK